LSHASAAEEACVASKSGERLSAQALLISDFNASSFDKATHKRIITTIKEIDP
jgi:hypothetical protein